MASDEPVTETPKPIPPTEEEEEIVVDLSVPLKVNAHSRYLCPGSGPRTERLMVCVSSLCTLKRYIKLYVSIIYILLSLLYSIKNDYNALYSFKATKMGYKVFIV